MRPQQAPRHVGGVGLHHAISGLAVGGEGFEGLGGHGV